jgi:magnesium transporter
MARRRKHRPLFRRRTKPGASPGTVAVAPDAPKPVIRAMAYGGKAFVEEEIHDVSRVAALMGKHPVLWLDVDGLGDAAAIEKLGELFHLHRLALEDVVNVHQRPKVERYANFVFLVARMVTLNDRVETEQISIFLGENFVLTFQEGRPGDCLDPVRRRIREQVGKIRESGPDYLAYALLDAVIDGYFPVVEECGGRLDALEESVLAGNDPHVMDALHSMKRNLLVLRRIVWPYREAVGELARETTPYFTEQTRLHLRDCYDHVVQLIDLVALARELTVDLRDLHMSMLGNRTNETMRVLTVMATIFIPLTFIVGVYGMNFRFMPELTSVWGYPAVLAGMGLIAAGMLLFFYFRGWLRLPKQG